MKKFPQILLSSAVLLFFSGSTPAQTAPAPSPVQNSYFFTREVQPLTAGAIVAGEPYSAVEVSENIQTLGDGTHISSKRVQRHTYRDSQGRTRTETPLMMAMNSDNSNAPRIIEIRDPIEGVGYLLDEQNHVAHRYKLATRGAGAAPASVDTGTQITLTPGDAPDSRGGTAEIRVQSSDLPARTPVAAPVVEQLGEQSIDGVMAKGTRTTRTFEVGTIGNDRPISMVCERWMSTELKLTLVSKCTDPRFGDSNTYLQDFSRSEPDSSLFQAPPDYSVVDETGPITFRVARSASAQP